MRHKAHEREADILAWYAVNRRILPWREDPTPYHVWLSEIMLQQTRVEAVKAYYERFLSVLPDISSLAAAKEDVYLKLWEGLGYYSRVRNLHKAAVLVMEEYNGELPREREKLQKLPGIGAYTSAAIASIAFGEPCVAVDGNFLRVFARQTEYKEDIKTPEAKRAAEKFYLERLPDGEAGAFNQAVMDLGATLCLPNGEPLCGSCPWQETCLAHREGQEKAYPVVPPKAKRPVTELTVFLIHRGGRVALRKRPSTGLLAGLYEFPNVEGFLSRTDAADYIQRLGLKPLRIRALPAAKHIFTHREWHMKGWEVEAEEDSEMPSQPDNAASGNGLSPESGQGSLIMEEKPMPGMRNFFWADLEEIDHHWTIPSAFARYKEELICDKFSRH